MSTTSQHMGLKVPDGSDPFIRADFVQNYTTMDKYPGNWICTSTTRPTWGSAQSGMCITETDTRRTMMWTGSNWREMLYGPAVWWGSIRPGVRISYYTSLVYTVGTFTVNRPGSLFVLGDVELSFPSTGNVAVNTRVTIDGAQSNWDGDAYGEYARSTWWTTPVANQNTWAVTMPIMGIRNISAGSHSIGFTVATNSTGITPSNSAEITSCRMMAMFVNGTDR